MTSEPSSGPPRRSPTIELTATEVDAEQAAQDAGGTASADRREDENAQGADTTAARSSGFTSAHAVGAATGIVATGVVLAGLWLTGYVPSRQLGAAPVTASSASGPGAMAPATTANNDAAISSRLDKIETALKAQQTDPALTGRFSALDAQMKSLSDSLAALNRRVDDVAGSAQSALAQAKAASGAAADAKNSAQSNTRRDDIDALGKRVTAIESAVKSLAEIAAQRAAGADDRVARFTVAAESLRAAVERGAPYRKELALVKSLGTDASATAPLEAFAGSGLPSAAVLAHELQALLPAMRQAAGTPLDSGSLLKRMESRAQQLVRITPIDAPPADDSASIIARLHVDAGHADIDAALADIAKLPDKVKALAADWVRKTEARSAAIAASRHISAAALAALNGPGSQ